MRLELTRVGLLVESSLRVAKNPEIETYTSEYIQEGQSGESSTVKRTDVEW